MERTVTAAFRDGWDRTFGPKLPKRRSQIICNPFPLRRDVTVHYEVPDDFTVADLQRFVRHLATMCSDWEPNLGFPTLTFAERP